MKGAERHLNSPSSEGKGIHEFMKIIILGAGQVGGSLAENLVGENNDITLVDTDTERLRELQDKYDLRVVQGYASHPQTLKDAGAQDADMLVAVTNSDETNMIACQVAFTLFNTPNRVARIRSPEYLTSKDQLFQTDACPVDHLIAPEELVTRYIHRLIEYPGALQVENFADNKVGLVAVKPLRRTLVGMLSSLRDHMPHIKCASRQFSCDRPIRPRHAIIEADDEVFFVAANHHIRAVMSSFNARKAVQTHHDRGGREHRRWTCAKLGARLRR